MEVSVAQLKQAVEQVMKTDTIRGASLVEVQKMVEDWKTSRPWARVVQEDAPYSHNTDIERGGWTVRITYEESASNQDTTS